MRYEYLIYPNAIEKLKSSGIEERVDNLKKSEEGLPRLQDSRYKEDIVESISDLRKQGFYEYFPKESLRKFQSKMSKIIKSPEDSFWLVRKPDQEVSIRCDLADLDLFSGDIASMILSPEELGNPARFNFSSPIVFATTVGAYVRERSRGVSNYGKGYDWISKKDNGIEVKNEITGSMDYDLRIYQTDITPHPTTDPFNNEIEMRPVIGVDIDSVVADHTTEAALLVGVMKYIEQQGIQTQCLKDGAKSLIEWGHSLDQLVGESDYRTAMRFFYRYGQQIPILDKANEMKNNTPHWVQADRGDSGYGIFIADNGDLILSYQNSPDLKKTKKPISVRFKPEDAEHLLKGLIFQSAKRLGRTPLRELLGILEYRYSERFIKDQKKYK